MFDQYRYLLTSWQICIFGDQISIFVNSLTNIHILSKSLWVMSIFSFANKAWQICTLFVKQIYAHLLMSWQILIFGHQICISVNSLTNIYIGRTNIDIWSVSIFVLTYTIMRKFLGVSVSRCYYISDYNILSKFITCKNLNESITWVETLSYGRTMQVIQHTKYCLPF